MLTTAKLQQKVTKSIKLVSFKQLLRQVKSLPSSILFASSLLRDDPRALCNNKQNNNNNNKTRRNKSIEVVVSKEPHQGPLSTGLCSIQGYSSELPLCACSALSLILLAMATDGILVWMDIFSHVLVVLIVLHNQGGGVLIWLKPTSTYLLFLSYTSVGVKKTLQTY